MSTKPIHRYTDVKPPGCTCEALGCFGCGGKKVERFGDARAEAARREAETAKPQLPTDSAARKAIPIVRGCLDYFPAALAAVAMLSEEGNKKHNPGEPLHHARGKSGDHADCIVRHLMERGTVDVSDSIRHSVKVAWRALAMLQEELEQEEGAPLARGAWAAPELDLSAMVRKLDPTISSGPLPCASCGGYAPRACQDC